MPRYVIKLEQPIEADSPEEAAETFRQWLRQPGRDELYSPNVDVHPPLDTDSVLDMGEAVPMDIAVFEWWHQTQSEFMPAYVEQFDSNPESHNREGDDEADPGWYSRLSAPGYLDCTEWDGPHDTQYLAMESLYNQYGE